MGGNLVILPTYEGLEFDSLQNVGRIVFFNKKGKQASQQ